jgi:phenylacetate-coenzyme A ligase PaaK-like adenylate-forming protein
MRLGRDQTANYRKRQVGGSNWALAGALRSFTLRIGGKLVGSRFTDDLREMQRVQWLSPQELKARAEARLLRILCHAAEHVPFYREIYRSLGLLPSQLRTICDLRQLPIVGKSTFRERPLEHFLAANVPAHRRLEWTTSGSTGEPFKFYLDRRMMPLVFASHLFYDSWFGFGPFDRYIRIMTPPADRLPLPENTPLVTRLRYEINSHLPERYEALTQRRFSMFDVDAERAVEIYRVIETFRPKYILGYTSTLATIADKLLRHNLRLSRPLHGAVTIAETLTPERRRFIEQYFGAPIINRYGQRELKFWCAQSCLESPDRFHVNTELVVWEVVREDGTPTAPGELGRLVLTNLHNDAMPFIRYDTGDLAVAGMASCKCGRGFPLVEQLEGRSQECLRTSSGKMINPVSLGQYLFVTNNYVDAVRHYQLVVEAPDQVRLLVVPTGIFDEGWRDRLQKDMARLLGEDVRVSVDTVEEIPVENSGKRPIIKLL